MIRRDVPRTDKPNHWLLISQVEHARISHLLAKAWDPAVIPSVARDEFLAAVLHHDDGWDDWKTAPKIDPEHGRPYGFTEMPPPLAQQIWADSIDECVGIGPLAAWVVASHFIQLQGKPDDDFGEWARWLGEQDRRRTAWLAEWKGSDPVRHTQAVADRCLYLLQQFDWLSLWLCCRGPIDPRDPVETLDLGGAEDGFGPYRFVPRGKVIEVSPWPFGPTTLDGGKGQEGVTGPNGATTLDIVAGATWAEAGAYESASQMLTKPTRAAWRLAAAAG